MVATRSGPRGRWCRSTRDSAGGGAVVRWVKEVAGVGGTYPRPSPGWRAVTGVAESNRSEYKNPGTLVDADSVGGDDLGPVLDRAALSGGHQLLSHTDAVHPGRDRVVGPDHHPRRVRPRAADPRCRAPGLRRRHPAGVVLRPRRRPRGVASTSVDALPAVEVIRFDVPRWGGSPTGPLPYRFGQLTLGLAPGVGRARVRPGRCARILLGRRAGRSSSPHNTRGAAAGWYW